MHFQRYFSLFQMRDFKAKERLKRKLTKRYVKQKKELIQRLLD